MDTTQLIALLAVAATVVAALIAGAAQILSARAQIKSNDRAPQDVDESGRWKHIVDPKTSSLEERIVATHLEASISKGPNTELKVIQVGDVDAKQ